MTKIDKSLIIGMALFYAASLNNLRTSPDTTISHVKTKETMCVVRSKLVDKLAKYSNRSIAEALAKTKRPYLYAAIAKIESGFTVNAVGDNGKSYGITQIQSQHWGKVPLDIEGQLKKTETILEPMIRQYGIRDAVRRYNGVGKKAQLYAKRVLKAEKEFQL